MKIALDLDGVLADVITSWIVRSNRTRARLSKQDVRAWDFWKDLGIDRFSFYAELSECWRDWQSIPCTEPGLSGTVRRLCGLGSVDIVTAREKSTDSHARDWLEYHGIPYNVYVSVTDGPKKADLDYDVFIDDSPINALHFLQNGKNVLLYSQPWNLDMSDHRVRRIGSLSEAVGVLESQA